jgi:hypothetical protein
MNEHVSEAKKISSFNSSPNVHPLYIAFHGFAQMYHCVFGVFVPFTIRDAKPLDSRKKRRSKALNTSKKGRYPTQSQSSSKKVLLGLHATQYLNFNSNA